MKRIDLSLYGKNQAIEDAQRTARNTNKDVVLCFRGKEVTITPKTPRCEIYKALE